MHAWTGYLNREALLWTSCILSQALIDRIPPHFDWSIDAFKPLFSPYSTRYFACIVVFVMASILPALQAQIDSVIADMPAEHLQPPVHGTTVVSPEAAYERV